MNIDTAVKNIKTELKTVQTKNKRFNNFEVINMVKQIKYWLKEIEIMKEEMLELGNEWKDNRSYICTKVNFSYDYIAKCYYELYKSCSVISDVLERINLEEQYINEYDNRRLIKI